LDAVLGGIEIIISDMENNPIQTDDACELIQQLTFY